MAHPDSLPMTPIGCARSDNPWTRRSAFSPSASIEIIDGLLADAEMKA